MAEQYSGIKYSIKFLGKRYPENASMNELKKWCNIFQENGFTPSHEKGTFGNLSFRIRKEENCFLITSAGMESKGNISDEHIVEVVSCDLDKKIISAYGMRNPSSECMLHYTIYKMRPEINAVFHGHCNKILATAKKLRILETEREDPYGSIELVESVKNIINGHYFIIMKNHGFISLGKTMKDAGDLTMKYYRKALSI